MVLCINVIHSSLVRIPNKREAEEVESPEPGVNEKHEFSMLIFLNKLSLSEIFSYRSLVISTESSLDGAKKKSFFLDSCGKYLVSRPQQGQNKHYFEIYKESQ